jgi:hypothetical protein
MSPHTELDPAAIVAGYLAVWNELDAEARRAAVRALWAPDGTEYVHEIQYRGYQELEARVTRAHQAFVDDGKYAVAGAGDVTRHGDIVTFTAQLVTPAGEVDWASRVFLLLDANGRVKEDYQLTVQPLPA